MKMAMPAEKMETNAIFAEIGAKIEAADKAAKNAMDNIERNDQQSLVKAVSEVDSIRLELKGLKELVAGLRAQL
jgi:hypothetical protein